MLNVRFHELNFIFSYFSVSQTDFEFAVWKLRNYTSVFISTDHLKLISIRNGLTFSENSKRVKYLLTNLNMEILSRAVFSIF